MIIDVSLMQLVEGFKSKNGGFPEKEFCLKTATPTPLETPTRLLVCLTYFRLTSLCDCKSQFLKISLSLCLCHSLLLVVTLENPN